MGFMEPQITDKERWAEVETNCGTEFVPLEQLGLTLPDGIEACTELLRDYLEGQSGVLRPRAGGLRRTIVCAGLLGLYRVGRIRHGRRGAGIPGGNIRGRGPRRQHS